MKPEGEEAQEDQKSNEEDNVENPTPSEPRVAGGVVQDTVKLEEQAPKEDEKPTEDEKPNQEDVENPNDSLPVGDVIGNTAYSERFVLKLLIKLANLDTLRDEILQKTFEEDLCTLWDMTTEKDVVLFLMKHNILNLLNTAWQIIDSPRILEIFIGIIGNMCCQKEAVAALLKMEDFLTNNILYFLNTDDSLILVQIVRLINSCLYVANDDDLSIWMELFKAVDYPKTLYFILKNSSHKDLIVTTMENFNTIASYFNKERFRVDYFTQFVTSEALTALSAALLEVLSQKDIFEREELERIQVVTFQITLNLVGFDKSLEIYKDLKEGLVVMIAPVLSYYENKLLALKEIDPDFIDIVDSTNTVVKVMHLSEISEPENYFKPAYSIWKALKTAVKCENNDSNFENDMSHAEIKAFATKVQPHLSTLICHYINKCPEKHLNNSLDEISKDYDDLLSLVSDEELKLNVTNRALNYRTRLNDNVDS